MKQQLGKKGDEAEQQQDIQKLVKEQQDMKQQLGKKADKAESKKLRDELGNVKKAVLPSTTADLLNKAKNCLEVMSSKEKHKIQGFCAENVEKLTEARNRIAHPGGYGYLSRPTVLSEANDVMTFGLLRWWKEESQSKLDDVGKFMIAILEQAAGAKA